MKSLSSRKKHEKGQGLVEYALILVLVAIIVIGGLTFFGAKIKNGYYGIAASLHTNEEDCIAAGFAWSQEADWSGCVAIISKE